LMALKRSKYPSLKVLAGFGPVIDTTWYVREIAINCAK